MRKPLLLSIMLLLFSFSYAQTVEQQIDSATKVYKDSITKLVADTTGLSWKTVYNDAKEGITGLAKALKVPADHVYKILVKQQIIKAITEFIGWFCIPLVLSIIGYRISRKYKFFTEETIKESEGASAFLGGIAAGVPLLFLFFGCDWSIIIGGLINPEYGAIQDIWKFVKH